ncbi:MAG: inner membrane CreD family protein [Candidatus Omnitrophica bacterium]|nr:inner membrane CreD family protein [Candidatus Omnitrophota bacterium]
MASPSFNGAWLPKERTFGKDGFQAEWRSSFGTELSATVVGASQPEQRAILFGFHGWSQFDHSGR